jgi:predicted O-linked N-acetylglucosamine transferase (SPINDLY family)
MPQVTIDQAMQIAVRHEQAGQLREAEQIYQQVLEFAPDYSPALGQLALLAHRTGRNDISIELLRRSIAITPEAAHAYCNLGKILCDERRFDESIAASRKAISLLPKLAAAHSNLGNALRASGQLDQAIEAYRNAVAAQPDSAEAHSNLGNALRESGDLDGAVAACQRAIGLNRNLLEAHLNLGNALRDKRQYNAAIAAHRKALALNPNLPEAHLNLGTSLRDAGQADEAITALRRAIALRPGYAEAYSHLGVALGIKRQFDEAITAYRQSLAIRPDDPETLNNLGVTLKEVGELSDGIMACRRAVATRSNFHAAHSNVVYLMGFQEGADASAIAEELRGWNDKHAHPLSKDVPPHQNTPDPGRRLRIGYVSADFRKHVVGRNVLPLLREHDRGQFDVVCYSNVEKPDSLTTQFREASNLWRDILNCSDEAVAAMIRQDQIDILVDLGLHMSGSRLLIFARKPAPVQVTFAGYPGSTGLSAMDYRLTDPYLDPPGPGPTYYCEESVRLPDSFWCYDPRVMTPELDADARPTELPAHATGRVTFGSLNNFVKVNDLVLKLWARVITQVPDSRLMLMVPPGSGRRRVQRVLSEAGVAPCRIEFVDVLLTREYFHQYDRIDIGLDTFPYNGHTTSLDALWMGVPVVTLVGGTVVGRAGLSQLSNLQLTELVASSQDEFVEIAAALARDVPRLAALRAGLRERMRRSPLTNTARFARNVESAYRQMWHRWCLVQGRGASQV